MTEPTPLDKAEAAVREASVDTAAVQLAFAAMELAKLAQQQPSTPPPACQHHGGRQGRGAGEWLAIGCAVCVGGVGVALGFLAIAISGISVAILALVLRSIWQDMQKKGG
ncbi:hypothetical protein [Streptomyces lincolnensis]|uniref:hypothetical protein n=1 Tax=Streptomyces lincolnensis TaxID=1915 RepID=UPI0037D590FF